MSGEPETLGTARLIISRLKRLNATLSRELTKARREIREYREALGLEERNEN